MIGGKNGPAPHRRAIVLRGRALRRAAAALRCAILGKNSENPSASAGGIFGARVPLEKIQLGAPHSADNPGAQVPAWLCRTAWAFLENIAGGLRNPVRLRDFLGSPPLTGTPSSAPQYAAADFAGPQTPRSFGLFRDVSRIRGCGFFSRMSCFFAESVKNAGFREKKRGKKPPTTSAAFLMSSPVSSLARVRSSCPQGFRHR